VWYAVFGLVSVAAVDHASFRLILLLLARFVSVNSSLSTNLSSFLLPGCRLLLLLCNLIYVVYAPLRGLYRAPVCNSDVGIGYSEADNEENAHSLSYMTTETHKWVSFKSELYHLDINCFSEMNCKIICLLHFTKSDNDVNYTPGLAPAIFYSQMSWFTSEKLRCTGCAGDAAWEVNITSCLIVLSLTTRACLLRFVEIYRATEFVSRKIGEYSIQA
jgi:hypothetical protein